MASWTLLQCQEFKIMACFFWKNLKQVRLGKSCRSIERNCVKCCIFKRELSFSVTYMQGGLSKVRKEFWQLMWNNIPHLSCCLRILRKLMQRFWMLVLRFWLIRLSQMPRCIFSLGLIARLFISSARCSPCLPLPDSNTESSESAVYPHHYSRIRKYLQCDDLRYDNKEHVSQYLFEPVRNHQNLTT